MPRSFAFILLLVSFSSLAQSGYEIDVTLKPYKDQYIYLGHYYGKQTPVIDSVLVNQNSTGTFKGTQKLGEGIYFIVSPDRKASFTFLITQDQHFGIRAHATPGSAVTFTSSAENTRFTAYQDSIRKQNAVLEQLYQKLMAKDSDSIQIEKELEQRARQLYDFRKEMIRQYPNTLLSDILKAMLAPEMPESDTLAQKDPTYEARYTKNHYWDAIKFYDDRLLRTPYLEPKLDFYFNQLVAQSADSVNREIDRIMATAVGNRETEKFMLTYFINRYMRPRQTWGDRVFLHVYDQYIAGREYPWLTESLEKTLAKKAYTVMATTQGKPATDIELPDRTGKKVSLYSSEAPYSLLLFWDPRCGHCQALLPVMDSLYQTSWKKQGFRIFAVAIEGDGTHADWTNTIDGKHLSDWTHVYYSQKEAEAGREKGLPEYPRIYEVYSFPTLYLLDKDKHIMAKKINVQEVDKVLAAGK